MAPSGQKPSGFYWMSNENGTRDTLVNADWIVQAEEIDGVPGKSMLYVATAAIRIIVSEPLTELFARPLSRDERKTT